MYELIQDLPYTIDHPDLTVSIFMENSIGLKRLFDFLFLQVNIYFEY